MVGVAVRRPGGRNPFLRVNDPAQWPSLGAWMERNVIFGSSEPRPGPFRLDPWQRDIAEAFTDPRNRQVSMKVFSQSGKSTLLSGMICWIACVSHDPALFVQPTRKLERRFISGKLLPLARMVAAVRRVVRFTPSGGVNEEGLRYDAGFIAFGTARAVASMQGHPARIVIADEIDAYQSHAAGDPIGLLRQRGEAFADPRLILVSTPTTKDDSRIEREYADSDGRQWWVPCVHCGELTLLLLENVKEVDGEYLMHCGQCGVAWTEADRQEGLQRGRWIPQRPEVQAHAGFHINEFASAVRTVDETMRKWDPKDRKTFMTQIMAEAFDPVEREPLDPDKLLELHRPAPAEQLLARVAAVDWQHNRIEYSVVDFHGDYATVQPHVRCHVTIMAEDGDFARAYHQLRLALGPWRCDVVMADVGANLPDNQVKGHLRTAFQFEFQRGRVKAVKGEGGTKAFEEDLTAPAIVGNPHFGDNTAYDKTLAVNTRLLKILVVDDLAGGVTGLDEDASRFPEDYYAQLASEQLQRIVTPTTEKLVWRKTRPRNEAFDCLVYAYAGLAYLGPAYRRTPGNFDVLDLYRPT